MANVLNIQVKGVKVNQFESKKGNPFFTFEVTEPVSKFISYTSHFEKSQLADLAETGQFVDLNLILKGNRLYFDGAQISDDQ